MTDEQKLHSMRVINIARYLHHKRAMFQCIASRKWLKSHEQRDEVDHYRQLVMDTKRVVADVIPMIHSPSELAKQIFADTKLLYRMH